MAEARAAPVSADPALLGAARSLDGLILRIIGRGRLAPVGVVLAVALLYAALFLLCNGSAGTLYNWRLPDGSWDLRRLTSEMVNGLMIGHFLASYAVVRRGALADLVALRPVLDCPEAVHRDVERRIRTPGLGLNLAALLAGALAALVIIFDPAVWGGAPMPRFPEPLLLWALFRNFAMGWTGFRLGFADISMTAGFGRLGAHARIDLLDGRPLDPFVRKGQRSVVVWIIFSSLLAVFWLAGTAASLNLLVLLFVLGMATAALLAPLSGVHRRIVATKQEELRRLNDAIRREREGLLGDADAPETPRLANLIAYRQLVESVHEWPLTAPALLRFGLFLLIGLGSWLGAALVERALESALG